MSYYNDMSGALTALQLAERCDCLCYAALLEVTACCLLPRADGKRRVIIIKFMKTLLFVSKPMLMKIFITNVVFH